MSGQDERPLRDFPRCPNCSVVQSSYWYGHGNLTLVYFDCIGYDYITRPRVVIRKSAGPVAATLEQVNQIEHIKCSFCNTSPDKILFEKIIELGRKIVVGNR